VIVDTRILEGFKMTEIGPLPEEWGLVKLGNVATIIMGQSPPGKTYNTRGDGVPFLQGKAEFGTISPRHNRYTTKPLRIGRKGSVLISVRAPVGDVNIADIDYCIGRGLASLSLNKGANSFLFYLLDFHKNKVEREGFGSTFRSINKSRLQNLEIPFPPLPEQKQIVFVLSIVQQTVEKTQSVINAARKLKESLMKHLFTYGPVSIDEVEKVVLKETETGLIPEEWEVVKLSEMGKVLMGQSPRGESYNVDGIGFPLINGPAEFGDQFPKISKWTSTPTKICERGDILFCVRGNTAGRLNFSDSRYCIGRGVAAICRRDGNSETLYMFYFLEKEAQNILRLATSGGSTFPNLTKVQLRNLAVPFPSISCQRKIANILSVLDQKIEAEQTRKKALEELFKALLSNLMTGKIRVTRLEVPHDQTWR
jgi:type I restriction enzyme S subunit